MCLFLHSSITRDFVERLRQRPLSFSPLFAENPVNKFRTFWTEKNTLFVVTLFVVSLKKLVSSRPRDSSETFLLGKLVQHHAQSPVR